MPATVETLDVESPPDGGYGWVCVASSLTVRMLTRDEFMNMGGQSLIHGLIDQCVYLGRELSKLARLHILTRLRY